MVDTLGGALGAGGIDGGGFGFEGRGGAERESFFLDPFFWLSAPTDLSQTRPTRISSSSLMNSFKFFHLIFAKHPAPLVLPLPIFLGFPFLFKVTPMIKIENN